MIRPEDRAVPDPPTWHPEDVPPDHHLRRPEDTDRPRPRGRPTKAPAHQRQHYGVYFTEAERAAIQAVMRPGEDFSAFMREAAALLIASRA